MKRWKWCMRTGDTYRIHLWVVFDLIFFDSGCQGFWCILWLRQGRWTWCPEPWDCPSLPGHRWGDRPYLGRTMPGRCHWCGHPGLPISCDLFSLPLECPDPVQNRPEFEVKVKVIRILLKTLIPGCPSPIIFHHISQPYKVLSLFLQVSAIWSLGEGL